MQYLFFDIECSDGRHICSFGYVLTDENGNVLKKEDILVNPECPFKLGRAGEEPGIRLAYQEKEFYRARPFADRYEQIRALLTAPDRVLLGHAIASDLAFLDIACERYGLPKLSPSVYDTQKIYARMCGGGIRSLENIAAELELPIEHLSAHKSCDDAEICALQMRELCRRRGVRADALIATYRDCIVNRATVAEAHRRSILNKVLKNLRKKHPDERTRQSVYISDNVREQSADGRAELYKRLYKRGYAYAAHIEDSAFVLYANALTAAEQTALLHAEPKPQLLHAAELSELLRAPVNEYGELPVPPPAKTRKQ